MNESQLRILSRLIKTQDGIDFINEIIVPMQKQNYDSLLDSGNREFRAELIGFGDCLRHLVGLFENCDTRLASIARTDAPDLV